MCPTAPIRFLKLIASLSFFISSASAQQFVHVLFYGVEGKTFRSLEGEVTIAGYFDAETDREMTRFSFHGEAMDMTYVEEVDALGLPDLQHADYTQACTRPHALVEVALAPPRYADLLSHARLTYVFDLRAETLVGTYFGSVSDLYILSPGQDPAAVTSDYTGICDDQALQIMETVPAF